jgi:hypothetical protein
MDKLTVAQEKTFKSAFGEFECKIPSLQKRVEIQKRRQKYAEMLALATETWDLIDNMALLDVVVTKAPASFVRKPEMSGGGFDYDLLYDEDGFIALGKEVSTWIEDFRKGL